MVASRRNTSQRLTLVILLLASVTVITIAYRGEAKNVINSVRNGAGDTFAPVQRVIAAVLHPIGNLFAGVVDYGGALSDNQRLQLEVNQLRRQLIESQQAQEQLNQLRADQNLPFAAGIPEVLGQVISSPSSNFDLTIEINRGTSNGVGAGMPVVSGAGLIGSVISAGRTTAVVQLLTNPGSDVGVRFGVGNVAVARSRSREPTAAQGRLRGQPDETRCAGRDERAGHRRIPFRDPGGYGGIRAARLRFAHHPGSRHAHREFLGSAVRRRSAVARAGVTVRQPITGNAKTGASP